MENKSAEVPLRDEIHLGDHKTVRWARNLEEIMYYIPDNEDKNTQSVLKKLKRKTCIFKNNFHVGFLAILQGDRLHRLQERFVRIVLKISGHCDEIYFEDQNEKWDELFELYGQYKSYEF